MAELVWEEAGSGRKVTLEEGPVGIGRAADNVVTLKDFSVSRHHARLELRDGKWWIVDLGSTNGVKVNGTYVQEAPLAHGDTIHIGNFQLTFREKTEDVSTTGTFLRPLAQFRKEITVETVLNSVMIADPLQLFDCCPFSDGAAAVVLATEELARKLVPKPVYILGIGQGSAGALFRQKGLPRIKARETAAKKAYAMAGLTPQDVQVCELHDCFTIAEIIASEGLGFFEFGRGGEAVEKGQTTYGGRVVINPSGGLKAKGHPIGATGAAQVYEIVKQLRGEAGPRQVEGARIGLTDTLGGDGGTVVVTLYGIE